MKWCQSCVLPDTRPNLVIETSGVCNACTSHGRRTDVDWAQRRIDLESLVESVRRHPAPYDCVIPVSGGKDSTWQLVTCLELGLHPLAVTWRTPARTAIGAANLANLVSLGVDHLEFQVNPSVEARFMVAALRRYGDPAIPMHLALFNIPLTVAARFGIPLVVWGENSATEYGTADAARKGHRMDDAWLRAFGGAHGTTAEDWLDELTPAELTPYRGPTVAELDESGVHAVFLGHYLPWDPQESLRVAEAHGFRRRAEGPKTGLYDFADIDDDFISVHHHIKWLKFGFTRLFDNLSLEIRNRRMTRAEAIDVIRARGNETPDADIDRLCEFTGLARAELDTILETWRNQAVWTLHGDRWVIEDFLIADWSW